MLRFHGRLTWGDGFLATDSPSPLFWIPLISDHAAWQGELSVRIPGRRLVARDSAYRPCRCLIQDLTWHAGSSNPSGLALQGLGTKTCRLFAASVFRFPALASIHGLGEKQDSRYVRHERAKRSEPNAPVSGDLDSLPVFRTEPGLGIDFYGRETGLSPESSSLPW